MDTTITIDRRSGNVTVGTHSLSPETTSDSLPSYFQLGFEYSANVPRGTVQCRFATAHISEHGAPIEIQLRFEDGVLVSCFFIIASALGEGASEDLFNAHARWVVKKLGAADGAHASYPWGSAGVARDRSGDVHIYLHNRNNSWGNG